MRTFTVVASVIVLTTMGVMPAAAQDPGKVGLTMTSESTVALTIQASDSVAVRPELGFIRSSSDGTGLSGKRTANSWSPGVSLLFKVKSWDSTHLYLSPHWTYSRTTIDDTPSVSESKSSGHTVSGMLGAQHNITNRFAVFGEVGIGRSSSKTDGQFSTASSHYWATRSTVGATLFF